MELHSRLVRFESWTLVSWQVTPLPVTGRGVARITDYEGWIMWVNRWALWPQPVLRIGYYYLLVLLLVRSPLQFTPVIPLISYVVLISKRSQGRSDHLPLQSI